MKKKGFTLIELVMALMVLSIVMLGIYSAFDTSERSLSNVNEKIKVQDEGNNITRRIEKDIVASKEVSLDATKTILSLKDATGATSTYKLTGTKLMKDSTVVSSIVDSLSFDIVNNTVYIKFNVNNTKESSDFSAMAAVKNWRSTADLNMLVDRSLIIKSGSSNIFQALVPLADSIPVNFSAAYIESTTDSAALNSYASTNLRGDFTLANLVSKPYYKSGISYESTLSQISFNNNLNKSGVINFNVDLVGKAIPVNGTFYNNKGLTFNITPIAGSSGKYEAFTLDDYTIILVDGNLDIGHTSAQVFNFTKDIIIVNGEINFSGASGNMGTFNFSNSAIYCNKLGINGDNKINMTGTAIPGSTAEATKNKLLDCISQYLN